VTTIAIDFDDTLTAAPRFWRIVIWLAKRFDIRFICVTCRRRTDENKVDLKEWMAEHKIELTTFFTNLNSKAEYMKSQGITVDIWIDDTPGSVVHGRS